jgi:hypothetical protein
MTTTRLKMECPPVNLVENAWTVPRIKWAELADLVSEGDPERAIFYLFNAIFYLFTFVFWCSRRDVCSGY